jgi:hypothetical protein
MMKLSPNNNTGPKMGAQPLSKPPARTLTLAVILLLAIVSGCSHSCIRMNITVKNEMPLGIDWAEVQWDGPSVVGGIISSGISKTTLDVQPPKSDMAIITFVEDISHTPHTNRLDISRLKRLAPGFYDVAFVIVSGDSAEL